MSKSDNLSQMFSFSDWMPPSSYETSYPSNDSPSVIASQGLLRFITLPSIAEMSQSGFVPESKKCRAGWMKPCKTQCLSLSDNLFMLLCSQFCNSLNELFNCNLKESVGSAVITNGHNTLNWRNVACFGAWAKVLQFSSGQIKVQTVKDNKQTDLYSRC